jgi:hypothetical protein
MRQLYGSAVMVLVLLAASSGSAAAQESAWRADITFGWTGLVDDSTKNYWLLGGSLRRQLTPRISIGPEIVIMNNSALLTDRLYMITGNVVFDVVADTGAAAPRVTPFVVVGGGVFGGRDQVRGGPFWHSDPAFTAGGGVRARVTDATAVAGEYRIGAELHQRVSGSFVVHW